MANRMISNNVLSILLIFAIFLSVLNTFTGILKSDGVIGFATNTTEVNLTVSEVVDISVPIRAVDFGTLSIGNKNWTNNASGWKPQSMIVQNDGSVVVNITIQSTQLFDTQASASAYYNYSANNYTAEANCSKSNEVCSGLACCFSGNMPIGSALNLTHLLNFSDGEDAIFLNIGIEVPPGEASGAKGGVVTLISAASS